MYSHTGSYLRGAVVTSGWLLLKLVLKVKGNLRSKKSLAQMKEREKCQKNEPSLTLICQMVLEIAHFKVRNLSKMDVAIL